MIPIDKNIPIPPRKKNLEGIQPVDRSIRYPWLRMSVGDSFLLELGPIESRKKLASMAGTIAGRSRRSKHKYTQRLVLEGIRIWRIA